MKFAAYGVLSSTLAMSMADLTSAPIAINAGALTILGWMVWYMLARAFPAHVKAQERTVAAFLEAQREAREDFREALTGMSHSIDCMAATLAGSRRGD